MIVFDKVTKTYGSNRALDTVSFSVAPGEFVFVLGPSGAGKSTLARLLIKETEASEGEITIGEFILSKMKRREVPVLRQQIGVIFQDYKLLPDRTAAENIALSLEIAGKPDSVIKKTVEELLRVVGLPEKGDLFPRQLSGGETQRVVIARALATDPAVLFADEPTGNLDEGTAVPIVELLERINHHGTTVIMATHDIDLVKRLKKRVLYLDKGKLVKDTANPQKHTESTETKTAKGEKEEVKEEKAEEKKEA